MISLITLLLSLAISGRLGHIWKDGETRFRTIVSTLYLYMQTDCVSLKTIYPVFAGESMYK